MKKISSYLVGILVLGACNWLPKEETENTTADTMVTEVTQEVVGQPLAETPLADSLPSAKTAKDAVNLFALFSNDTTSYQFKVKTLFGKPIDFYLTHKELSPEGKLLFEDARKIGDNAATYEVLNQLISTKSEEIRPFYFHLCNYMAKNADGSLSEAIAPAMLTIVQENPSKFADYVLRQDYSGRRKLFDDYVFHLRFELRRNGNLLSAIESLKENLDLKCADCPRDTQMLLDLLIMKLKDNQ